MRELEMNPYVIQIDKFVKSLDKLSNMFLRMGEEESEAPQESLHEMKEEIRDRVCRNCDRKKICTQCDMLPELLHVIENFGADLNIETKRKIQKKCNHAPQFLRAVLDVYKHEKRKLTWRQKMDQNREGCVVQLERFAQMVQHSTRELDASIFADEYLEKKIRNRFARQGLRLLSVVFFLSENGRYEIHVTVKAVKGECITTRTVASLLTECTGRSMKVAADERSVVGSEFCTIVCSEKVNYQTIQGVAKIGKGCETISGDNFSMRELPGGKVGVVLSDGMGCGQSAHRESARLVDVLEELLDAGFSKETALQMLNTAMVIGREDVKFSTIDMSVFDLYTGALEIVKAGASTTYIKREESVENVKSDNLPLGVMANLHLEKKETQLSDGDMVIMVTDGIMDALPSGEQELLMQMIIEGVPGQNPKEIAHHILEQVLTCSGEIPSDDMTVIVVGIWSLEK